MHPMILAPNYNPVIVINPLLFDLNMHAPMPITARWGGTELCKWHWNTEITKNMMDFAWILA